MLLHINGKFTMGKLNLISGADPGFVVRGGVGSGDRLRSPAGTG
jgi:hypothetical protein